ncbi:M1 family metallopeptidase [Candidatus Nitrospira nitrificans]|uniref:Putative Peptidase M n=1 Tax=Candidatus Nitrospira nitrificans TaxID=1742973 RepID=A0A0S4LKE6_9BACT|nr:M1 family aminopeptidase [Candidatus Nitrospira nitrificans]CUS37165.1 putative Peptidase M [Candidatus Nitrospira nitrificans]
MPIRKRLLRSCLIVLLSLSIVHTWGTSALSAQKNVTHIHHALSVELIPATHELVASDLIELEVDPQVTSVTFSLAHTLHVEAIAMRMHAISGGQSSQDEVVPFTTVRLPETRVQRIVVSLPKDHGRRVALVMSYRGQINDPPREPRHLRFVTPSETAGHIGMEGVYLSGESRWYPDVSGSFGTYRVTAQVPLGWTVVASGRKEGETANSGKTSSIWIVQDQSEAFTLVANKFVTTSREWKSPTGQRVELQTHFFPDNAGLADEYLDATARYLEAYVGILGSYPFDKFAVVENFFASGLGLPSFTLLGSGSIKRHYIQPYALGHEIVHSWIGNSVFNRDDHGNWVEGMTTYLANYYWHEATQDVPQAFEQRRMMLDGYNLYVTPETDYAVSQFLRKHDEKDNAIGYQKAAFVFHLLRQAIGDEPFWRGVKTFVSSYRNRPADWKSIEEVFARESGQDLRWFFEQWVEQPGAPRVSLRNAHARLMKGEGDEEAWRLTVQIEQAEKSFRMTIPLRIVMKESTDIKSITLSQSRTNVAELVLPSQPLRVELDPQLMTFRRLTRHQLPPMLNVYVTDPRKTVVRAFSDPASPLQQVVSRIADHELTGSLRTTVVSFQEHALPHEGSLLVLAGVDQRQAVQSVVQESCGDRVALGERGFRIDGQTYDGPTMAVLFSCHRANVPGSVITVLYGVTSGAVEKLSRFLFYYGWHSYIIFQDGAVTRREVWHGSPDVKEVMIDATS